MKSDAGRVVTLLATAILGWAPSAVAAGEISFGQRVAAQNAIETVYWRHRIWPKQNPPPRPSLSFMMSDDAIRAKVEDYLRKSSALETRRQRPITGDELQDEIDRMSRETRDPGMLRELYAALDDDPQLIAETLARQSLVDRLPVEPDEIETEPATVEGAFSLVAPAAGGCVDDTWSRPLAAPISQSSATAVWTGAEMIVWGGTSSNVPASTGGRYSPATNTWIPTSTGANVPSGRVNHSAVWTGTEMIVWGGNRDGQDGLNTGGRYDPSTDTWMPISTGGNAPTARTRHRAVWTGTEMIVWGGADVVDGAFQYLDTGGRYDPSNDTWMPTSTGTGVPSGRDFHSAVWTDTEMIVWGGGNVEQYDTGGLYDPSTDTWIETSTGTNVPDARKQSRAVWTGTEMIVWGGAKNGATLSTGARYAPSTDTWTPMSTGAGVPSPRALHTMVWTRAEMIVWGGLGGSSTFLNTGGRYDPANDAWIPTSIGVSAPAATLAHVAVWADPYMIVWGGVGGDTGVYLYCACPDPDGDGACGSADPFPSSDPRPTVVIGTCDSGVANEFVMPGANMGDLIGRCGDDASSHGEFVGCVAHLTTAWVEAGQITSRERSAIQRCAALP
jgi:N-acetylneuraminic acid mutarotase